MSGIVICVDSKRIPINYLKRNVPPNSAYHVMKKIGYMRMWRNWQTHQI